MQRSTVTPVRHNDGITPRGFHQPSARLGMTLIEVMIVLFILTIAVLGVMTHTYTLSQARAQAIEMAQIQQITSTLTERFQGAAWSDLQYWATTGPAWAKPRRRPMCPTFSPHPMACR